MERNSGFSNIEVDKIAAVGMNSFAGTFMSGVFLSTADGRTWNPVNNGLLYTDVYALATTGDTPFAATCNGGVFRTTDHGQHWNPVNTGISPSENQMSCGL